MSKRTARVELIWSSACVPGRCEPRTARGPFPLGGAPLWGWCQDAPPANASLKAAFTDGLGALRLHRSIMKRTPLFAAHQKLGAKLIEFGGSEMTVHYTSIMEE